MGSVQQYDLFFLNKSGSGGNVCVYQDAGNVSCSDGNPGALAWMVCGANPDVQIDFQWKVAYDCAWFNVTVPATQQLKAADAITGTSVVLALGQYGYLFTPAPAPPVPGTLSVQGDYTIPTVNNVLLGIGMSGAGTFAFPAQPNVSHGFSPAGNESLAYWVAFGGDFQLNRPVSQVTPSIKPLCIRFPAGVFAVTVTLTASNILQYVPGPPASTLRAGAPATRNMVYRAGQEG
ncbi:hypothetical protein [Janthinobacterium sp. PC23-8]|uniref:hypothetical protein n=1 Tax=Janthinobacterium sp. PC23-8 TaxID=2012679 RepID=UPI000B96C37D|nr:hypothetical protein [Janthinobacterium sp. PC23-8]OYO28047.1 hypothetical protein CD932_23430 [Janthinobacterium sp. PC23-8]